MSSRAGQVPDRRLEDVSIEMLHVGDYVFVENEPQSHAGQTVCVLRKATTRQAPSNRVTGWRVELQSGATVWLPRGARVKRRRFRIAGPT